jgi:isoprenylcysteine carboxyl methyltransferase (ICMT) family protein YpbQ
LSWRFLSFTLDITYCRQLCFGAGLFCMGLWYFLSIWLEFVNNHSTFKKYVEEMFLCWIVFSTHCWMYCTKQLCYIWMDHMLIWQIW